MVQKFPNRHPAGLLWKLESNINAKNVYLHSGQFLTGVVESPHGSEVVLTSMFDLHFTFLNSWSLSKVQKKGAVSCESKSKRNNRNEHFSRGWG